VAGRHQAAIGGPYPVFMSDRTSIRNGSLSFATHDRFIQPHGDETILST
jgi:hypothetical protein